MKLLEPNSVDAIITDPPYGLEFMGKEWDDFKKINSGRSRKENELTAISRGPEKYVAGLPMQIFFQEVAIECLRVLKPGGFLLAFGGTRTYHRLACGIEDAGFEIRDCIQWLYGSGFPKSLNIGKQIDKMNGTEKIIGMGHAGKTALGQSSGYNHTNNPHEFKITEPNSPEAKEWEGWGTALKPANEPIVVARKPLSEKNVALNVLKWGTGGINIDACRIGTSDNLNGGTYSGTLRNMSNQDRTMDGGIMKQGIGRYTQPQGRFPANIILDEEAGRLLDEQSGITSSSDVKRTRQTLGSFGMPNDTTPEYSDKGGASRFFYCAKASKSERNFGCEDLDEQNVDYGERKGQNNSTHRPDGSERKPNIKKNNHPTVKPIKLMEYLIKLVSKEGATILDPFLGSGTTAIASIKLGRKFIGIEKEEEYIKIAKARIKPFQEQTKLSSGTL